MITRRSVILIAAPLLAACGADPRRSPPTPSAAPLRITMQIVAADTAEPVRAAVFVDDQRVAQDTTEATVMIPSDGQRHQLRVEAEGFEVRMFEIAGDLATGRRLSGPVRLKRKE
jgi:hypothetical protein